jgi:hypothetical protein
MAGMQSRVAFVGDGARLGDAACPPACFMRPLGGGDRSLISCKVRRHLAVLGRRI